MPKLYLGTREVSFLCREAAGRYIRKIISGNQICRSSEFIDLSGITEIGDYGLAGAYCEGAANAANPIITVDLSDIEAIKISGCENTFDSCKSLTSIDLSNLKFALGERACYYMFANCTSLTTVSLPSLLFCRDVRALNSLFAGCTSLQSVDLSHFIASLYVNNGYFAMASMFAGCSNLTTVRFDNLFAIPHSTGAEQIFSKCASLVSMAFPKLCILGHRVLWETFVECNSLQSVSFPALQPYSFGNMTDCFNNMLYRCANVTVHFPSNLQSVLSSWSDVIAGFGGTNTTILYDLPATSTTVLNLNEVTVVPYNELFKEFIQNYQIAFSLVWNNLISISASDGCNRMFSGCTGLSTFNLSGLQEITGDRGCYSMFEGCTGLTSAAFGNLRKIIGSYTCYCMFKGCTNLTSVTFNRLRDVSGSYACGNMFQSCTSLQTLSFPALTSTSFGSYTNQFNGLLSGTTGVTLHFPSNMQSTISGLSGYPNFSGTNTVLLYDLPATS